jgi:Flp pilus assembly protein TadD
MVAAPPDLLPHTPPPERIAAAAAALERVDPAAARIAYDTLARRAPALYVAWIGSGNTAYALRDFAAAAAAFERATSLRPDAGDAWNNLALALLAAGRRDDARRAAQRAVDLGGPRAERYRATLESIGRP